jgi:hypothetical protein
MDALKQNTSKPQVGRSATTATHLPPDVVHSGEIQISEFLETFRVTGQPPDVMMTS